MLKMQQQNQQLTLANTQILTELNSAKDRLKVLQHELGCKNGLLKARQLELEETARMRSCKNANAELIKFQEEGESSEEDRDDEIPNKTKRSSQSYSVSSSEQVQSEKNQNKRPFVRRQSARFKAAELKPAELKVLQHELGCTSDLLKARQLELEETARARSCKNADAELIKFQEEGEASKEDRDDEVPNNIKRSLQSNSVSSSEQVQSKVKTENKRPFVRRQSARFRAAEPKPAEDLFQAGDTNPVPEKGSTSESASVKDEDNKGSLGYESQDFGRPTLSRPSRLAAKKVQSYKEIPVNVKMRRPE